MHGVADADGAGKTDDGLEGGRAGDIGSCAHGGDSTSAYGA
jgi:hypothetical protein